MSSLGFPKSIIVGINEVPEFFDPVSLNAIPGGGKLTLAFFVDRLVNATLCETVLELDKIGVFRFGHRRQKGLQPAQIHEGFLAIRFVGDLRKMLLKSIVYYVEQLHVSLRVAA